jgi:asparagine synthase (glutamine-hydrolysing)
MCGIAGIIQYANASLEPDLNELKRMTDAMRLRGPDGEGSWMSPGRTTALGHRRLSIIDLSEHGNQPMAILNGRYTISFNGEIYNYRELRKQLADAGVEFHSQTDTEVLLHLYARKGEQMLPMLRGMFAFCIWDEEAKIAFMAKDPYGIKPLYYAEKDGIFRFASQVKALLAGGSVSQAVDPAGKAGFYLLGSIPEPFTFYRDIRALPAGSWMKVTNGNVSEAQQWFSIPSQYSAVNELAEPISDKDYFEHVRAALLDSVRHHMIADVPVGAFLSAGIDSTSLVGIMRDADVEDIQTITLAFDEFKGKETDEAPLAQEVASLYGTDHAVRYLGSEEFRMELPSLLAAMDQPSIDGINSYFVSKAAAERGLKVALSGLGGDELFAGYNTFEDVPAWVTKFKIPASVPLLGKAFREAYRMFVEGNSSRSPKVASALEYGGSYAGAYFLRRGVFMPWELETVMDRADVEEAMERLKLLDSMEASLVPDPGSAFGKVSVLESCWYMRNQLLRDTDWAGMAHSLEIRVPFVDSVLLRKLAPLNARFAMRHKKKAIMESPTMGLPLKVKEKAKTGFFVPIQHWLETEASIDAWRSNEKLAMPSTPWARKWAYSVVAMTEQNS